MIKMKKITIESEHQFASEGRTYTDWYSARALTWNILVDEFRNDSTGGYSKTWFEVEFEDGEIYKGRLDIGVNDPDEADIGTHIVSWLKFISGQMQPAHMSDEQYEHYVASECARAGKTVEEYAAAIEEYLNTYEVVVYPVNPRDVKRHEDARDERIRERRIAAEIELAQKERAKQERIRANFAPDQSADLNVENIVPKASKWVSNPTNGQDVYNADIWFGQKIRIYGYHFTRHWENGELTKKQTYFEKVYDLGDRADYDFRDYINAAPIAKISKKTITVQPERGDSRQKRLDLHTFITYNM